MTAHQLLSRERFVENALCMGLGLATRGALGQPDVRGDLSGGAVECKDGQGSDVLAMWNPIGVVVMVHDHDKAKYEWKLPTWPLELSPLVEQLVQRGESRAVAGYWRERATGGLWITGNGSESTLEPADPRSVLCIVDYLCGPGLVFTEDKYPGVKALLGAMAHDDKVITEDLARVLLRGEAVQDVYPPCSSLEAGRMIAADLKQFGFQWPDLELHLAQIGGSSAGTALTSSQCTDARTIATSPDKQGERP